jgi:hypothetical protein
MHDDEPLLKKNTKGKAVKKNEPSITNQQQTKHDH